MTIQPRLDGGSLKSFNIYARFSYPLGWYASLEILQEGQEPPGAVEVSRLVEGSTEDLVKWWAQAKRFITDTL